MENKNWLYGDKGAEFPIQPEKWQKVGNVEMPKEELFKTLIEEKIDNEKIEDSNEDNDRTPYDYEEPLKSVEGDLPR
jgi:hypothetical protein